MIGDNECVECGKILSRKRVARGESNCSACDRGDGVFKVSRRDVNRGDGRTAFRALSDEWTPDDDR